VTDFLTDLFTDANGTDLASHTPDLGGAWTEAGAASCSIQGNKAQGITFGSTYAVNAATPPSADYAVEADVVYITPGWGNLAGVVGRFTITGAPGDGYAAYWVDGGAWTLDKFNGGGQTNLGTAADAWTSGTKHLVLEMIGSAITLSVDGSLLISATDSSVTAANSAGIIMSGGLDTAMLLDSLHAGTGGPPSGTHIVSGRGNFAIGGLEWLSTSIAGRPSNLTNGMAEPPNYYHVGMLSWGTANGAMVSYPVTRDLDLVHIPPGCGTVFYEFVGGVTATIVELSAP
jgi:hypothetical protein